MINAIQRMWRYISPHHRRIRMKRRLQDILREHGISNKTANIIASQAYRK